MRRPIANPPNPFVAAHREWLGEVPPAALQVYEETARSILSENDSPDLSFRWSVNPYRGCQHACAYCYARPTHEYIGLGAGTDFDSQITVKVNAAVLLERALSRPAWPRERIVFSGVTDCYQPLEAVYGLTRACLDVCRRFQTPAGIVTKAYLVVRDAELLAALNEAAGVRVFLSIPFARDANAKKIEPGAPPPSRRFEALRRLHAAGVPTGVMVAPLIPGLNDREVPEILERAAEAGAQTAAMTALRLPGSVREVFLPRLRAELPLAARAVELRIRGMRRGELSDPRFGERMRGHGPYWEALRQLFQNSARKAGLSTGTALGDRPKRIAADPPGPQPRSPSRAGTKEGGGKEERGQRDDGQLRLFE